MFQTMADFTPVAIMVVGLGQVGIVAWGIYVMQKAGQKRSEQMEPLLESVREANRGLAEATRNLAETNGGIRELLDRDRRQG